MVELLDCVVHVSDFKDFTVIVLVAIGEGLTMVMVDSVDVVYESWDLNGGILQLVLILFRVSHEVDEVDFVWGRVYILITMPIVIKGS